MKIYISGKITDASRDKELENMKKFEEVETWLLMAGFDVFNPCSLETEGWTWEQYLAHDLVWIHENRPMLYVLPNWEESRGARLEVEYAKLLGLTIMFT